MRKLIKNIVMAFVPFLLGAIIIVCCGFFSDKQIFDFSNKQLFDFTYQFDYAYIFLPDGMHIEGKVDSWTDYDEGDQLQVKIDGVTYLTHASNVVLVSH